uniref:Pogo transposable element with KRAB domain-like n=1 Tax=Saccoglossus kowalevskii TaxID=10224 RepID=A0ABM0M4J5_SACKO
MSSPVAAGQINSIRNYFILSPNQPPRQPQPRKLFPVFKKKVGVCRTKLGKQLYNGSTSDSSVGSDTESATKSDFRHRYTLSVKRRIVVYAQQHGQRAAARQYSVHHSNVTRWMRDEATGKLNIQRVSRYGNIPGSGGKLSYPKEIEDKLVKWILELRDNQVPVSTNMLRQKAKELIRPHNVNPVFKSSAGWARRFLSRHSLSIRRRTSMAQRLPTELEDKITAFHDFIVEQRRTYNFPLELIGNMDETPAYFDLLPNTSIAQQGTKTVSIHSTGAEKCHLTVILTVLANGTVLSPMIIFKGVRKLNLNVPKGMVVEVQKKG